MSRGKLCVEYGKRNIMSVNGKIMDFQYNNLNHNGSHVKEKNSISEQIRCSPNITSDSLNELSSHENVYSYLKTFNESDDYIDPYEFRESCDNNFSSYKIQNEKKIDPSCCDPQFEVSRESSTEKNYTLKTDNLGLAQNQINYKNTDIGKYKYTIESQFPYNKTTKMINFEPLHISNYFYDHNYTEASGNTTSIFNENISLDTAHKYSLLNENNSIGMIRILDHKIIPASSNKRDANNFEGTVSAGCENMLLNQDSLCDYTSIKSDDSLDSDYEPMTEDSSSSNTDNDKDIVCPKKDQYKHTVEYSSTDGYFDNGSNAFEASGDNKTTENLPFVKLDAVETKGEEKTRCSVSRPFRNEPSSDRDLCPFCFESVGHFSRHLLRKHSEEEVVKKILHMKNNSKERRLAVIALRRKGNFILKSEQNKLKPVRRPFASDKEEDYYPCTTCLGFFKKSYLWRHRKQCNSLVANKKNESRTNHLSEAQTFIASNGLLGNYLEKSRLRTEVFSIMKPDQISLAAKSDALICLYGESYLNKHKRKQMNVVASNKMREIARLLLALRKFTTFKYCIDFMRPEVYESIIAATKIICGFNVETKKFEASSLALHLGTNLKFLCDVAKKAVITKNPLLRNIAEEERDRRVKQISELRDMISSHWCNDISSLANKVLNESKLEKPMLVPLTEDIKMFNNYVMTLATEAYSGLKRGEDMKNNYKCLAECTLCLLLVFNRKRIGEVQFLDISTYQKEFSTFNQEEILNCLTEFEKNMCSFFKRVVVFGKGSKPVPILFTKQMQQFTELLLEIRRETDIVPKKNKYIFANPDSSDRWMSGSYIVRKFAYKCGAKKPELLTSTKFRKQIATILQLLNFQSDEMEQIARFMGHTEKTHKEFYRLTEDTYQTAKVAKVLLLLNAGKGHEFKGKFLKDIDVSNDAIEFDEVDEYVKTSQNYSLSISEEVQMKGILVESCKMKKSKPLRRSRGRWSAVEKQLILKYFQSNIAGKIAPKKQNCLAFIRMNENLFTENDWVRIKTFVYNTYRLQ